MSPITERRSHGLVSEHMPAAQRSVPRVRPADGAAAPALHVERTSIRFHDAAPGRVRIAVDVENRGAVRSAPTNLRLESAPLGAFLPWRPLATLAVPAIAPGGKATIALETPRPRPRRMADSGGRVPSAPMTATDPAPAGKQTFRLGLFDALLGVFRKSPATPLSEDPFDLLGRSQPHWAGNINVWIGRRAVERHAAPRLRVYPGRVNVAAFCVGDRRDRYAFRVERPAADWSVDLSAMRCTSRVEWTEDPWEAPRWLELRDTTCVLCCVRPPVDCEAGALEVHVTQRSSGQTAVVELDLDPGAAGPGCYVA